MKGNFDIIINGEKPVLVDFHAEWCGPCKMQAPILREIAGEIGERVKIIKIDVDRNQAISNRFQVTGVPTLILFKNGVPVWRQSGVANKRYLMNVLLENS